MRHDGVGCPVTASSVHGSKRQKRRLYRVVGAALVGLVLAVILSDRSPSLPVVDRGDLMTGWHAYDYRAGVAVEPAVNMFNPAVPTDDGVSVDDRLWSIDDPESPKSVLALVRYAEWEVRDGRVDTTRTAGDDLRDTTVCFDLRGDLDLKGGHVTFWVMSEGQRWHHKVPLEVGSGWTAQRVDTSGEWHNSWRWSPDAAPDLASTLQQGTSYGIGFVGFGEEQEPTGRLGMRGFELGC